ncbi:cyclin-dependent kinase G-2-like [Salvia miltiorrhiza]|uniref:cyclin-dependent kinase G-2-like n=1 Tax=Salvia miltiorrhiza TaxID=226208 RepID=UPI0025AC066E|nr:cyclin-dependent kinase G-2-like [Salvia miltiorrhiza]
MRQLLIGVKFLHDNKVVHRDLKPDNIFINTKGELKICDFGLSLWIHVAVAANNPCAGTVWYIAPELPELLGSNRPPTQVYPEAVDMWSLGCVMAEMLLKDGAYWSDEVAPMVYKIAAKGGGSDRLRRQFPGAAISAAGFDLLERLLRRDPKYRITAECALCHPWFEESLASEFGVHPPWIRQLRIVKRQR